MHWCSFSPVLETLQQTFYQQIKDSYPQLSNEEIKKALEITPSKQVQHGHYQCNSALKLSKLLKQKPRDIADKLKEVQSDCIESSEVAGPGFINIFLKKNYLESLLNKWIPNKRLEIEPAKNPKKIIVEFSSPNTAKELHVGHLRSTIIGDSIARLFEFLGHDVLRLNHIGDWGTPFGMLICHLKDKHPKVLSGQEKTDLSHLAIWYKESRKRFDEDPQFKKRAQEEVVRLQAKEDSAYSAWKKICEISKQGYQEIYDLLDIKIQERGESFYHDLLPKIIEFFEKKGMVEVSDHAKCLFLPGFVTKEGNPLPTIIQKADGGYNYATTDLAAIQHRVHEEKADRVLMVVDNGQSLHFQMVLKAAEMAHLYDPNKTEIMHVPFGLVLGEDGTKFKTRSGDSEKLIDLLLKAIEKAESILKTRSEHLNQDQIHETAKILGINAVKYADLSCVRTKDYQFSYDKMLQFEGNTAAFLMYAYVRIQSIQKKAHFDLKALEKASITLSEVSEMNLALHLVQLKDILHAFAETLYPNRLCEYLYQLANHFNAFFRDCPVLDSEHQNSRLLLIELTKRAFEMGFNILGLKTVDRM